MFTIPSCTQFKGFVSLFFSNLEVVKQETAMSCLHWTSRKSLIYKWKAEDNVVYKILIKNKNWLYESVESLLLSLQREQVFTCTWVSWNKLELQTARGFPHLISQLAPGSKDSQTWTSQHLTCITLLIWPDSRFSIAFILVKPHKIVLRTIRVISQQILHIWAL